MTESEFDLSEFEIALAEYVSEVTGPLSKLLQKMFSMMESGSMPPLPLPLRAILFGVVGRFHWEMAAAMNDLNMTPLEAYGLALSAVVSDPLVGRLMDAMLNTGINAAVVKLLE